MTPEAADFRTFVLKRKSFRLRGDENTNDNKGQIWNEQIYKGYFFKGRISEGQVDSFKDI